MDIEYNGRKPFARPRKLVENSTTLEQFQDRIEVNAFGQQDERSIATDELFTDLTKTYLKGEALKTALSTMDPAQFIPIEDSADSTRAAAIRLDKTGSREGKILPFSLYQTAVDNILKKKWEIRGEVINMRLPASVAENATHTAQLTSGTKDASSLIKEFISQNGIITTIIGMLTISPFQTLIFQALTVEEGAKGVQTAQIPAGIALFIELGIKAERILAILRDAKVSTPLVEQQIDTLSKSESARADALKTIGLDYGEFKKSQEFTDSQEIVKYVSDYYTRYGGLDAPDGHLSIDHWIAYLHVAQNQQTIRGALNTSHQFSPKFFAIKDQYTKLDQPKDNLFDSQNKERSKMFIQLASATRSLRESSNTTYDKIAQAFIYYLTDKDLCCLVQVFGELGNPKLMYTIASLLRILATNLAGEIVRIENMISRFLANLAQDALFEIIGDVNEFYYKIAHKVTKAFTIDPKGLEGCLGLTTLGWSLLQAVNVLFDQIRSLLKEISSIIGDFGSNRSGEWEIAADRRHLLGMARLLEVLAARIDLANTCATDPKNISVTNQISDPQSPSNEAIFTILGSAPPKINITESDLKKHFPDLGQATSKNLRFNYGILSQQNNESGDFSNSNCHNPDQKEKIQNLIDSLKASVSQNFNG